MRYGYFDDARREYVINRPDTPLPWINYLGSEDYFSLFSNTAGGYSFYKDARLRRLIRYRYNNAPPDLGGRFFYLRDDGQSQDASAPLIWSPTWQPIRRPLQAYECRHGLGYSQISSRYLEIETSLRAFVPPGESLEIWEFTLTNHRPTPAQLSLFAAVEFNLWDAWDDATNFQRNLSVGEVEVADGVIFHKSEYRERRNHFAYFAASEPARGFDTQREAFLGPYRGWQDPLALETGRTSNSLAQGWQPIGVHHLSCYLPPGEQKKVVLILGYQENAADQKFDPSSSQMINKAGVQPILANYLDPVNVDQAFHALRCEWGALLEKIQVQTPELHADRMVNIWNVYQNMATFNLSRSASYFESGIGRGIGFRDSNQDLLGFVHLIPERARARILDLAATQLPSGGAYHQYQPLTKRGNHAIGKDFNDDPLWLVLAVAAYLKETADWTILDELVCFDNQPGSEASLYEHLRRSLQYTLDRLGPHDLPLIGRADWNDCLNLNCFSDTPGESFQTTVNKDGRVAESVFIAGLFILAAREMAAIAERIDQPANAAAYEKAFQAMQASLEQHGWDGAWFLRAYDNFGQPVGSKDCIEGQIFIEPQGINIMAGVGLGDGRAQSALDAVAERLATPHGIVLHQPAYSRYYLHLGEISSYPPGLKENGSIFCHTNPWIMIAEARLGRGDRALDYYLRINPSAREPMSEVHRCEPYVYSQMIAGPDAKSQGEAKNSWLTGTAAWNYIAITQWILGLRPTYDGLEIAPVVPDSWPGFNATRLFRGVRYQIAVERIGPGNQVCLQVDGCPIEGAVVRPPAEGVEEVLVEVKLGST